MDVVAPVAEMPIGDDDYPALFRTLLIRSVTTTLAGLDPQLPHLEEEARERSLYALGLALELAEAWPGARDLLLTIAPHMEMQGYRAEWGDFLARGLAVAAAQEDRLAQARLCLFLGRIALLVGAYAEAEQYLTQARQQAEALGAREVELGALERLATAAVEQSDFARTRALVDQALGLLTPDDPAAAQSYQMLGYLALRQGENQLAIQHYTRALTLRRQQQAPRFVALAVRDLAFAYMYARQYEAAKTHFITSIEIFHTVDSVFEQAQARMDLGIVHWYLGEYEVALACYDACAPVFLKTHSNLSLAKMQNNRGLAFMSMQRYGEATTAFAASRDLAVAAGSPYETANVLESWGVLHQRMGELHAAVAKWQEALEILAGLSDRPRYLWELIEQRMREVAATQEAPAPPGS